MNENQEMNYQKIATMALTSTTVLTLAIIVGGVHWFWTLASAKRPSLDDLPTEKIRIDFKSTATKLSGSNRLQVAEVDQVELMEIRDSATFVGIPLPDVVITAKVPVNYVFFVDLKAEWELSRRDNILVVIAPKLEFNEPAADISRAEFNERGSILRDEDRVREILRSHMTPEIRKKATENIEIARAASRKEVETFVRTWLNRQYGISDSVRIEVRFRDEVHTPDGTL